MMTESTRNHLKTQGSNNTTTLQAKESGGGDSIPQTTCNTTLPCCEKNDERKKYGQTTTTVVPPSTVLPEPRRMKRRKKSKKTENGIAASLNDLPQVNNLKTPSYEPQQHQQQSSAVDVTMRPQLQIQKPVVVSSFSPSVVNKHVSGTNCHIITSHNTKVGWMLRC